MQTLVFNLSAIPDDRALLPKVINSKVFWLFNFYNIIDFDNIIPNH